MAWWVRLEGGKFSQKVDSFSRHSWIAEGNKSAVFTIDSVV